MALISDNMGLMKWNALSDRFDYKELADNFEKIDAHDHTAGKGTQIPEAGLQDASVSGTKLQSSSVNSDKLADNAVTSLKLQSSSSVDADRAVSTNHIRDNAVTADKIDASITAEIDSTIEAGVARLSAISGIKQEQWREPIQTGNLNLSYTFDSSTSNSDPGAGKFRLNNATLGNNVTKIYINKDDLNDADITNVLSNVTGANKKATIKVQAEDASYGIFRIESYEDFAGVYFALNVIHIESQGTLANVPVENQMDVEIYAIGLLNGWSGSVKYYRDTLDRVHIEFGNPANPAYGPWQAEAFYLPEGYRPFDSVWIPSSEGFLRIYPNGAVRPTRDSRLRPWFNQTNPNLATFFVANGSFRAFDPEVSAAGQTTIQGTEA